MRLLIPGCLGLAALSLVLPSVPTYDPWSWIVWGREIAHLELDTTGGPSWKPFPVLFTTVFSAAGAVDDSLPPLLWLVVARAGALLALALVFRLARRLVGPAWPGVLAGLVAAAALACTPQWLRYMAHGNEAPLAVAAMLWAVERHLDGSRRAAVALCVVACLMRPEVFPFLALYAAWAWRAEPATRRVTLAGAVILPVMWLVPEWIGSGQPLAAGSQATSEPSWSLSRLDHPWLELLGRAHETIGPALELGVAVALVVAWRRRDRVELALAGVALTWVALVAAMTQSGFSGNPRYLLPATVLACLLTGAAVGHLARGTQISFPLRPLGALRARHLALAALSGLLVIAAVDRVPALERQARTAARTAELDRDLGVAVTRMGGGDAVVARGAPAVDRAYIPRMAWLTGLPLGQVERRRPKRRGLVFAAGKRDPVTLVAQAGLPVPALTDRLTVGRWRVYEPR